MKKTKYKIKPISYLIDKSWRVDNFITGLNDFISYIKDKGINKIIEVGSFLGDSTVIFAKNLDLVYSVDPYIQNYDIKDAASFVYDMFDVECNFINRTSKFNNIIKMKMTGSQAADIFDDKSLDLVYIDSNHQYEEVKQEILNWIGKIRNGMYISGHDYENKWHPGVKQAVDEVLGSVDATFDDYSWIKKIEW